MSKSPEVRMETSSSIDYNLTELKDAIVGFNDTHEVDEDNDNPEEYNKSFLESLRDEVNKELEGEDEENLEQRSNRKMSLSYILESDGSRNHGFELESYGCKMVLDNGYIYDITDGSRMEVMRLEETLYKKLYDQSGKLINNDGNKKFLKAIFKTMNLVNYLRKEKFSRNLRYEGDEDGGIRAIGGLFDLFNDTVVVKKETLKKLSKDMGMDEYRYPNKICEYLNKVKKI